MKICTHTQTVGDFFWKPHLMFTQKSLIQVKQNPKKFPDKSQRPPIKNHALIKCMGLDFNFTTVDWAHP